MHNLDLNAAMFSGPCLHESQPRVVTKGRGAGRGGGHPEVARAGHWGGDGSGHRGRRRWLGGVHHHLEKNGLSGFFSRYFLKPTYLIK